MINEEMITTMLMLSAMAWATMDKLFKPTLSRILDGYKRPKLKPVAYQIAVSLIVALSVLGGDDVSVMQLFGKIPVGSVWVTFDFLGTVILIVMGNETIHRIADFGRLYLGEKGNPNNQYTATSNSFIDAGGTIPKGGV